MALGMALGTGQILVGWHWGQVKWHWGQVKYGSAVREGSEFRPQSQAEGADQSELPGSIVAAISTFDLSPNGDIPQWRHLTCPPMATLRELSQYLPCTVQASPL